MINNKTILALIPARGGSKGIPKKNIKPLLGKPLIAWTIEQAKESRSINKIIVSTEDREIAEITRKYGAEVIELARGDYISSKRPTKSGKIGNAARSTAKRLYCAEVVASQLRLPFDKTFKEAKKHNLFRYSET